MCAVDREALVGKGEKEVPCYDPATKEYLGSVPAMDKSEVEGKIKAAEIAAEVSHLLL
jgi:acyl-CoA reductase-like NAD-dependent aldehyde dehydrogenase